MAIENFEKPNCSYNSNLNQERGEIKEVNYWIVLNKTVLSLHRASKLSKLTWF